ncbi:MAG TPA: sensor domain-containing protein [Micromonosporaceae bacterium]|nr:sensor domain-containing protein [Micromonosporaceae bacterium]
MAGAPPRPRWVRQLGIDTAYVLAGMPLALAAFIVAVVAIAAGVGNLLLVVGFPILAGTFLALRALADIERNRIASVLRLPRTRPIYRAAGPAAGVWRRWLTMLADTQSWLDLLHGIVVFPVAVATYCLAAVWWSGAIGGLLYWTYDWALPHPSENNEMLGLVGLADTAGNRILLYTAIGLVFALSLPYVLRGCAVVQASLGRALLTGVAELRQQITGLQATTAQAQAQTAAAVSAEATALRRLERDIHDGPQQRLVRLALDLGRAQRQLDTDPAAVRQTLAGALTQAGEALDELRALSRGIAPPILADRGLTAAVAALAALSAVPVDLDADGLGRLDPAVETAAYFVVAEALANIAKHSRATECWVVLHRTVDRVVVTVTDNGDGGAQLAKGHGLAGLSNRVRAIGGTLTVTSPVGGPTTVAAELPCG